MADALVELARRALDAGETMPAGHAVRPHVSVLVGLDGLLAKAGESGVAPGELASGGPISAAAARRISCHAGISRVLADPAGAPLDVGRERRLRDGWPVDGADRKRRRMRLSWLYAAGDLVRRPSSGALGRRRTNRPPQPGAAVRLPPSGGPSSRVGRHPRRGRSPRVRAPALDRSGSNPATQHSASIYPRPMTGRCTMPGSAGARPRHHHKRERTVRRIAM